MDVREPRVGFLIAGVQKGGTNSLNAYLDEHPAIWMPKIHDPHFFDTDAYFETDSVDYSRYHACFEGASAGDLLGEATPIYLYWPEAARRIYIYNPAIKIIALLRGPVERAWSHWRMESGRGDDTLPFSRAIRCEPERLRQALPGMHRKFSYIDRGYYSEQIRRLRRYFPDDQILFVKSERMFSEPARVTAEAMQFLGVPVMPVDTSVIHYAGAIQGAMPDADRRYLLDLFRKDIELTETLLGWDCRDWLI